MGILPVEISGKVLNENSLDGSEVFSILGLDDNLQPNQAITVKAKRANGEEVEIAAKILLQTPIEIEYYRHGGILQYTLRQLIKENTVAAV